MTPHKPDLAERAFRRRRRTDSAFVLPVFGVVLLVSPVFDIFARDIRVLGIPLPIVYVFTVWLVLILLAQRLARHLTDGDRES